MSLVTLTAVIMPSYYKMWYQRVLERPIIYKPVLDAESHKETSEAISQRRF